MKIEKDFKEFIELLNRHNVRYLIIGGFAFSFYAEPRYTKDIDFLIDITPENAGALINALNDFGFGSVGLKKDDFLSHGQIIQLGNAPVRIDIITSAAAVTFSSAWKNRTIGKYGDVPANFISKSDLIKNKKASGRKQDIADIEKLKKI